MLRTSTPVPLMIPKPKPWKQASSPIPSMVTFIFVTSLLPFNKRPFWSVLSWSPASAVIISPIIRTAIGILSLPFCFARRMSPIPVYSTSFLPSLKEALIVLKVFFVTYRTLAPAFKVPSLL